MRALRYVDGEAFDALTWLLPTLPGLLLLDTPSAGTASITTSFPCSTGGIGVNINAQWLVDTAGLSPCPTLGNSSYSDILEFTVGQ